LPGEAFALAISSCTDCGPPGACTATTEIVLVVDVIGAKSLIGS